jgi:hypothetical protein
MGIFLAAFTAVFYFLPVAFPFFPPSKGAFAMNANFRRQVFFFDHLIELIFHL